MITREIILSQVPENEIYRYYTKYNPRTIGKKNVSSPFTEDKNPSFHFYRKQQRLLFKCFSSGYQGDCFELVKRLKNVSFFEALMIINKDFKLNLERRNIDEKWNGTVYYDDYTEEALNYWKRFGVTEKILHKYCVLQLRKLCYQKKTYYFDEALAFQFWINGRLKVYIPKQPNFSTKILFKDQSKDDIFGLPQLPFYKLDYLVVTEGEKDCLVLNAAGIPAVSFQSCNINVANAQIRTLYRHAKYIVVIYDNDEPGQKGARKLCKAGNFLHYTIPNEFNDIADYLPTIDPTTFKEELAELVREHEASLPVFERSGMYWKRTKHGIEPISNFIIEVENSIAGSSPLKQFVLISASGKRSPMITVPNRVFTSSDLFEEFCLNVKGNFDWSGSKKDLQFLRRQLFEYLDHYEEASIGWHASKSFIFCNRIVTADKVLEPDASGLCPEKELYLPFASSEHQDNSEYSSVRKIRYNPGTLTAYEYFEILNRNYDSLAPISFAWLFASIFFDLIKQLNPRWFPFLNIAGQKGAGKGSLIKMLLSVYSDFSQIEEISLHQVTNTAMSRSFAFAPNIPVWFDEYRNDLSKSKIEVLKNAYDMIGKKQAIKSHDNRTVRTDVVSPLMLTGQEVPTNEALFSRCISLVASVKKTNRDVKQFANDVQRLSTGLGNMFHSLLKYRPLIAEQYTEVLNTTIDRFITYIPQNTKTNIRLIKNYACIYTPISIAMNNGLKLPMSLKKLEQHLITCLMQQIEAEDQADECNVFLETIMHMATDQVLKKEVDYQVKDGKLILATICLMKFKKYYYEHHKQLPLDIKTLRSYLRENTYFVAFGKHYFSQEFGDDKKQLRSIVLELALLPDSVRDFFTSMYV